MSSRNDCTDKPLKGKHVLIPRGTKQAKAASDLVEKYGGIPEAIPLLAFKPASPTQQLEAVLANLSSYDWIIFTSHTTVETFLTFVDLLQQKERPKIAAIGSKTEASLCRAGLEVEFIPREYVAEGFVAEFQPLVTNGMKVFIPKGNLARNVIAKGLEDKGAVVDEAIIYETYFPEESKRLLIEKIAAKELDVLLFTSPSTIDHFMEVVEENRLLSNIDHCLIGSIGPITTARAKHYGLPIHSAPAVYTFDEMITTLIAYIIKNEE